MEPQHLESLYPAATRKKEIAEIFALLKQGKSCQLIGMPGAGRANILGLLSYNRNVRIYHTSEKEQFQYHFVMINFSEVRKRPLFDVMKFIFLELTASLHERRREEEFLVVDKLFKEALTYQDALVLFQRLKDAIDFLTLEKNLTVSFLFERFETYLPEVEADFFNNLRSMRNRAKYKFSVVFSINRPLEDMVEPDILADFQEFVAENYVYLSLKDSVGLDFRLQYLEKLTGKKIAQETYNQIIQSTQGHSKLTRLCLEAVIAKNMRKIDQELLLALKTIQSALKEIWLFLTPDEQQDILSISAGQKGTSNTFLEHIELINHDKRTIPLFQSYIKKHALAQQLGKFVFDSMTQSIKQGDMVISDRLTRSEFRLLMLLLEKGDTVITREEIIHTVWSESKTQEGVSEQALDQLILRLRKKIERDPNDPQHIQTVKGRGIRFVQ